MRTGKLYDFFGADKVIGKLIGKAKRSAKASAGTTL
jgi:hypothetical protein|tara:strand:- start:11525 stop:11632 length:108 start_codon:yes stop_codon:yes gene_type:complete